MNENDVNNCAPYLTKYKTAFQMNDESSIMMDIDENIEQMYGIYNNKTLQKASHFAYAYTRTHAHTYTHTNAILISQSINLKLVEQFLPYKCRHLDTKSHSNIFKRAIKKEY